MAYSFPPYTLIFIMGGLLALLFAAITWIRRHTPGTLPFSIFLIAVAICPVTNAFATGTVAYEDKVFWAKVMYFGVLNIGAMWFSFTSDYAGSRWWKKARNLLLLYSLPLISLPVIWTNELHGWFWSNSSPSADAGEAIPVYHHGFWFWIQASYQYCFSIAGFIYGVSFFYFKFLDIVPIARSLLVENLPEGILVLNSDNSVMDVNPAAARFVGHTVHEVLGKSLDQTWLDLGKALNKNTLTANFELLLALQGSTRYLNFWTIPLKDKASINLARVIVLTDATECHHSEKLLNERAISVELTGLYNHSHFQQHLDEEISKCSRSGGLFSLLSFDIDLFKAYNDVYGHLEGDKILHEVYTVPTS